MERDRGIWSTFLKLLCSVISLTGCNCHEKMTGAEQRVEIHLTGSGMSSKASLPDEELISDVSLMIFDENGDLEKYFYDDSGKYSFSADLLKGIKYSILACANMGYGVRTDKFDDRENIEFHLAYPDEYKMGIPMSACLTEVQINEEGPIEIEMERLMACISIRMDRSRLSEGVKMDVIGVRIGNCPKKVKVFSQNRTEGGDDCFKVGFRHDDIECSPLNKIDGDRLSESINMYMLENMQGTFSTDHIDRDDDKVFAEHDPRKETFSYIEVELDYSYQELASKETPLIYRFYLGENLNSLDVERNCHYQITICPEDDGLKGDGWRVDKGGIGFSGQPELKQYPSDYIVGDIGDVIHIGCNLRPSYAPFDIGLEYLEADSKAGIYDYVIDPDGHGVTLTLTGPGTGLIYMEAGDPINDAALFLIEVNLPDISPYKSPDMTPDAQEYRQRQDVLHHLQPQAPGQSPSPPS